MKPETEKFILRIFALLSACQLYVHLIYFISLQDMIFLICKIQLPQIMSVCVCAYVRVWQDIYAFLFLLRVFQCLDA